MQNLWNFELYFLNIGPNAAQLSKRYSSQCLSDFGHTSRKCPGNHGVIPTVTFQSPRAKY